MRRARRYTFPVVLLALVTLTLGPALAALGAPCASGAAAARAAQAACSCSPASVAGGHACCRATPSAAGPSCSGHSSSPSADSRHVVPSGSGADPDGMACQCGLPRDGGSPAMLSAAAARARVLLAGAILAGAAPAAASLLEAPERGAPYPPEFHRGPGSQHESRPDAGRAPPAS
ncbi:MAG: hypothetical protein HY321_01010 [Armatimonadetes bacterium]|nr:hypothetical protein [Armatimonadota bacterium]